MNNYIFWGSAGGLTGSVAYYVYYNSKYRYREKITLFNRGTYIGVGLGLIKGYIT